MKGISKRYQVFYVNMLRKWYSLEQVAFDALEATVDREEEIPEYPVSDTDKSHVVVDKDLPAEQRKQLEEITRVYSAVFCD
jgi:hypothetical protein